MTPSEISQYLGLALAIVALLGHAKGYFSSGEKTLTARMDQSEKKLVEHDRRIQAVESEMKHLPDRDMAHRLELAVEKMSGRLDTMAETLKPIRATTERMNELLVEQAKK